MRTETPLRCALAAGVLCLGLLPALVRAEPPAGTYAIRLDGDARLGLLQGTEDICRDTVRGRLCVSTDVQTDATGLVSGSAVLTLDRLVSTTLTLKTELALELEGQLSGTTAKPRARLLVTATGTIKALSAVPGETERHEEVLDAAGSGTLICKNPAEAFVPCEGRITLCMVRAGQNLDCRRLPFFSEMNLARTPVDITLELATDDQNVVTGSGNVQIGERPATSCSATGKYAPRADAANLRLECTDPAANTQLVLKKTVLEAGAATSGTLVFKVAGQKGKASLAPPEPAP